MSRRGRSQPVLSLFSFQDIITSVTGVMILVTLLLAIELIFRKEGSPTATAQIISEIDEAIVEAAEIESQVNANNERIEELKRKLEEATKKLVDTAAITPEDLENEKQSLRDRVQSERDERQAAREQAKSAQEAWATANKEGITQGAIDKAIETIRNIERQIREIDAVSVIAKRPRGEKRMPLVVEFTNDKIALTEGGHVGPPTVFSDPSAVTNKIREMSKEDYYIILLVKPSGVENYLLIYDSVAELGFDVGYQLLPESDRDIATRPGGTRP